jgi:hypothetical protein
LSNLADHERSRIIRDLITVDPSHNHHEACHLPDESTSDWICRSEEWGDWINGNLRLWWIDGIPGAGKTVLVSHMIERVRLVSQQTPNFPGEVGWVYYYCYHARTHISENEPFLRWVISTLSRQAHFVPQTVVDNSHDISPKVLWNAFVTLAARFEKVLITIDALDECKDRREFLNSSSALLHPFPTLASLSRAEKRLTSPRL